MTIHRSGLLLLAVLLPLSLVASSRGENWPRWRGPDGTGQYAGKLPTKWSPDDVQWRTELPAHGHSSPIVWENRIFLTGSKGQGKQRVVMCLDRKTGKVLWEQVAWSGEPERAHAMNLWASATCACDGERVVAFFGKGGLHAYDLDGKKQWSVDLGTFAGPWGTAASPVIVGDLVIQNGDADDSAYLYGVDKTTGKVQWKTERFTVRGWSTPILVKHNDRTELALNGHNGVNAYDPATGKELWSNKVARGRGTPTLVTYEDFLVSLPGRAGDMVAVRTGGSGDVTDSHEVWRTARPRGRDLGSPIVAGKHLVVVSLRPALATGYDIAGGQELWKERLEGSFSASPITAGGLVYLPNDDGTTFVIRPDGKPRVIAKNTVNVGPEETFRASLAAVDGQLLLRSDKAIYCIGKP